MTALLISDVTVRDAEAMQTYRTRAAASIAEYGGRYLARGGAVESLEGTWNPCIIIVAKFRTIEQARAWYHSAAYASALEVKEHALTRNLILVEGLGDHP